MADNELQSLREELIDQYTMSIFLGKKYGEYEGYRYIVGKNSKLIITQYDGDYVEELIIPECFDSLQCLEYTSDFDVMDKSNLAAYLKRVNLGNIQVLDRRSFANFHGLEEIIGSKVKSIGSSAFNFCEKLRSAKFAKCQLVEELAFNHCSVLAEVELGANVILGNGAFRYCPKAKMIG